MYGGSTLRKSCSATAANALLPDGSASYWVTPLVEAGAVPPLLDGFLEVQGFFPAARYFSFVSYTATGEAFDAVSDFMISPTVAGTNPFATRGAAAGAPYSLRVVEANGTQAAAAKAAEETVLLVPKGAGSVIYRIYGANPGTNVTGLFFFFFGGGDSSSALLEGNDAFSTKE